MNAADIDKVIAQYDRIVRNNDAVKAVAADEHGEVMWEVWETAADLGFDLTDADHAALYQASVDYQATLRSEVEDAAIPVMTDDQAAEATAQYGNPDGWMIPHHRAVGATCNFGPFKTIKEAHDWWRTVGAPQGVSGGFIPLRLDVDWTRP